MYEEWGSYMTDERPTGARPDQLAVRLPVEGWRLDRKVAALAAMASQTGVALATFGTATYVASLAEESYVEASGARETHSRHSDGARRQPAAELRLQNVCR